MVKHIYHEIIVVQYCSVAKKWAWPSKHFLACAACGLLPPRSKNPSYAPVHAVSEETTRESQEDSCLASYAVKVRCFLWFQWEYRPTSRTCANCTTATSIARRTF